MLHIRACLPACPLSCHKQKLSAVAKAKKQFSNFEHFSRGIANRTTKSADNFGLQVVVVVICCSGRLLLLLHCCLLARLSLRLRLRLCRRLPVSVLSGKVFCALQERRDILLSAQSLLAPLDSFVFIYFFTFISLSAQLGLALEIL